MKRENLTWAELWPLVGDGQCFDWQEMSGSRPFKYKNGILFVWSNRFSRWDKVETELVSNEPTPRHTFKLVDDPSEPKQAREIETELRARAKQIFDLLEIAVNNINFPDRFKVLDKPVLVSGLVNMFELLRVDLIREIEERTK